MSDQRRTSLRDFASDTNLVDSAGGGDVEIQSISDVCAARLPSAYRDAVESMLREDASEQPTGDTNE